MQTPLQVVKRRELSDFQMMILQPVGGGVEVGTVRGGGQRQYDDVGGIDGVGKIGGAYVRNVRQERGPQRDFPLREQRGQSDETVIPAENTPFSGILHGKYRTFPSNGGEYSYRIPAGRERCAAQKTPAKWHSSVRK